MSVVIAVWGAVSILPLQVRPVGEGLGVAPGSLRELREGHAGVVQLLNSSRRPFSKKMNKVGNPPVADRIIHNLF